MFHIECLFPTTTIAKLPISCCIVACSILNAFFLPQQWQNSQYPVVLWHVPYWMPFSYPNNGKTPNILLYCGMFHIECLFPTTTMAKLPISRCIVACSILNAFFLPQQWQNSQYPLVLWHVPYWMPFSYHNNGKTPNIPLYCGMFHIECLFPTTTMAKLPISRCIVARFLLNASYLDQQWQNSKYPIVLWHAPYWMPSYYPKLQSC